MEKPLVKIYLVIIMAIVLAIVFVPAIIGRMSAWAAYTSVELSLIGNKNEEGARAMPDKDKGNAVIIMDDGWETQYTRGYEILKGFGVKASIAVIPAVVGSYGYMSYSQLAELYMAGWDMLNHTYNHAELTGLSATQQKEQVATGRNWLRSHLLDRGGDILVYPGGSFSNLTIQALKEEGVIAARSLKSVWTAKSDCTLEDVDICNLVSGISLDIVQTAIGKAVSNRSAVIFILHKIEPVTDGSGMQTEEDKFSDLARLITNSGLNVLTMSELVAGENGA